MARTQATSEELLRLVVEEVDDARDIYELALQLAPHLPIRSFDDLLKAGEAGRMRFRDTEFDIESMREHVPALVLPVEDVRGLVERLGVLLRLVPPHLGVDLESESGARRQLRSAGVIAPGIGLTPSHRPATATSLGSGARLPLPQSNPAS